MRIQPVSAEQLRAAIQRFRIDWRFVDARPLERGHIHDTFVSRWDVGGEQRQFIHQRLNDAVFPDLDLLMQNIHKVSDHMVKRLGENGADGFEIMRLVPARSGDHYARTSTGAWRTFVFIENTTSFDRCQSENQAFEAARAFGWFQKQVQDLPSEELGETLENFFSSPHRYDQFVSSLANCDTRRKELASEAIEFAGGRQAMVHVIDRLLASGAIPHRVVHGDTKLNNILFDEDTGRAKGIVDLDTCMAGYSLYDFGDLVRFTAATCAEDETDLDRVGTDLEVYKALAEGYLSTARDFLTKTEIELMPFAARLVTYTIGLRFLTDYLAGDPYLKTEYAAHNLDRARVQFGMVEFMEKHEESM